MDVCGVCVRGGEAGGHRRLYRGVWIKGRKLNQTLVGGPFQWLTVSAVGFSSKCILPARKKVRKKEKKTHTLGIQSPPVLPLSPLQSFSHLPPLFSLHCLSSFLPSLSPSPCFSQSLSGGDRMVSQYSSESLRKRPRATRSLFRERLSLLNLF